MKKEMKNGTTIAGYIRGLDKATVLNSTPSEIMSGAPAELSRNRGTWSQAIATRRTFLRGTPTKKGTTIQESGLGYNPLTTLPVNVRERIGAAVEEELTKVEAEVKTIRESWQKILG